MNKSKKQEKEKEYVIIGGGLMGILTAYYLTKYPLQNKVTIIEKQSEVSEGASFANAGLLCPTLSYSIAHPKIFLKILTNIFHTKSIITEWFNPDFWRWSCIYFKESMFSKFDDKTKTHHELCSYSLECLNEIMKEAKIWFPEDYKKIQLRSKLLLIYRNKKNFIFNKNTINLFHINYSNYSKLYPYTIYNVENTKKLLQGMNWNYMNKYTKIIGSVLSPIDKIGDAREFSLLMKKKCIQQGVKFVHNTKVMGFSYSNNLVKKIHTSNGSFTCSDVILCAGSYTPTLTKLLGVYTPIIPLKGYSISYKYKDREQVDKLLPYTIQDNYNSVGIIRFDSTIRIAGLADCMGYNYTFPKKREKLLHEIYHSFFPEKLYTLHFQNGLV